MMRWLTACAFAAVCFAEGGGGQTFAAGASCTGRPVGVARLRPRNSCLRCQWTQRRVPGWARVPRVAGSWPVAAASGGTWSVHGQVPNAQLSALPDGHWTLQLDLDLQPDGRAARLTAVHGNRPCPSRPTASQPPGARYPLDLSPRRTLRQRHARISRVGGTRPGDHPVYADTEDHLGHPDPPVRAHAAGRHRRLACLGHGRLHHCQRRRGAHPPLSDATGLFARQLSRGRPASMLDTPARSGFALLPSLYLSRPSYLAVATTIVSCEANPGQGLVQAAFNGRVRHIPQLAQDFPAGALPADSHECNRPIGPRARFVASQAARPVALHGRGQRMRSPSARSCSARATDWKSRSPGSISWASDPCPTTSDWVRRPRQTCRMSARRGSD